MITGQVHENGTLRLILTGDTDISKAALKQLDGALCKFHSEPIVMVDKRCPEGALIVELTPVKAEVQEEGPGKGQIN